MTALLTTDVREAAAILRKGGLVAFATETVYGLGGNALDPQAVARIFDAKQRPKFDPLIVHLPDAGQIGEVVSRIPDLATRLMDRFWPGPLTLVLPRGAAVPDLVTAGLPTVAVRVPAHPQAREFLRLCGVPVAAPSANLFGQVSPTRAEHVREQLADRIDAILDGGPCPVGIESTVLQIEENAAPLVLRPGGLPLEEIESVVGTVRQLSISSDGSLPLPSPGMLSRHYAPRKQLRIVESLSNLPEERSAGALAFGPVENPQRFAVVEVLSESRSLVEAAANFFAALHRLDAAPIASIVAESFPEEGLGLALNDRLRRAAHGE